MACYLVVFMQKKHQIDTKTPSIKSNNKKKMFLLSRKHAQLQK